MRYGKMEKLSSCDTGCYIAHLARLNLAEVAS